MAAAQNSRAGFGPGVGVMGERDRWRLPGGALLLSVAVLAPVGQRLSDLMLVFGGAVLASALSPGVVHAHRPSSPAGERSDVWRGLWPVRRRPGAVIVVAVGAVAAFLVTDRLILNHGRLAAATQRTLASADPVVGGGRAIGALRDPELHVVAVGAPFTLLDTRVRVSALEVCQKRSRRLAAVPVSLSAVSDRVPIGSPSFQLLDARQTPHDPSAVLSLRRRRGTSMHAAPPPRVFNELLEFRLPRAASVGWLGMDVQSATGTGVVYRVRFDSSATSASPPVSGSATCALPGGAA